MKLQAGFSRLDMTPPLGAYMDLQFDEYPRNAEYILNLRQKMTEMIRDHLSL